MVSLIFDPSLMRKLNHRMVKLLFSGSLVSNTLQPHGLHDSRFPCLSPSLELAQTHAHWVSDTIQPSHPLLAPSPAFNLSQYQGLFQWVSSWHQVAKVLELQLQHVLPVVGMRWEPSRGQCKLVCPSLLRGFFTTWELASRCSPEHREGRSLGKGHWSSGVRSHSAKPWWGLASGHCPSWPLTALLWCCSPWGRKRARHSWSHLALT